MNETVVMKPKSLNLPPGLWLVPGAALVFVCLASLLLAQQPAASSAHVVGTVQAIDGKSLTVVSDAGAASTVAIGDSTRLLQIEPGKTDLKEATPLALSDLQPGDRVLVRGAMAEDGKTLRAASLIAMKKAAISERQSKERTEWQRGVGGLVKSVDPATETLLLATGSLSGNKEVAVHLAKDAVLRRYAPDSTRFESAKPAPFSAIRAGDQLRARGTRSPDGASFDAVEVVSGSFRNIAGTISSVDASSSTLVVQDLALKAPVTLKITPDSQMRKLPAPFAERLAARLKGQPAGAAPPAGASPGPQSQPAGAQQPGAAGPGGGAGRGGGDFQQMIARMPPATLSDLQKGDAVMVVATEGNEKDPGAVITLLGGVDAILRASPKGGPDMILSPWSLGGGEPAAN
jgi:hypothetical protein